MWPFDRYPTTDFNKINLDWIMRELRKRLDSLVTSVNGQRGDVVLTAQDVGAMPADAPTPVLSVNGRAGSVVLDAEDVGAMPDSYVAPVASVNGRTGAVVLTAQDVGAMPADAPAMVTSVNGQAGAVILTAQSVGALSDSYVAPVASVNGQTGAVVLTAQSVGAMPAGYVAPVTSVNGQTGDVIVNAGGWSPVALVNASGVVATLWASDRMLIGRINGAVTAINGTTLFTISDVTLRPTVAYWTWITVLNNSVPNVCRLNVNVNGECKIYDLDGGDTQRTVTLGTDMVVVRV